MTKTKTTQIIAIIALACIVLSVLGTGLLYIFSGPSGTINDEPSLEQLEEIRKIIEESNNNSLSGTTTPDTTNSDETGTGTQE